MPNFSAENNCHRVRKIESEMHSEYLFEVKQEDSLQQRPKNQKQISLQEILFWIFRCTNKPYSSHWKWLRVDSAFCSIKTNIAWIKSVKSAIHDKLNGSYNDVFSPIALFPSFFFCWCTKNGAFLFGGVHLNVITFLISFLERITKWLRKMHQSIYFYLPAVKYILFCAQKTTE